jgi:hypothetical protein
MPPLLAANRLERPLAKFLVVFNDFYRHLIVALERLLRIGPKRFHSHLPILSRGRVIDFEIEAAFVNDAEESFVLIKTDTAEHASRVDVIHFLQLIKHKILE